VDVASRRVLTHKVAVTLEPVTQRRIIEEAFARYGTSEIVNVDQGSQFTSDAFTSVLKREGVMISMDGRGRAFDMHFCRAALTQREVQAGVSHGLRQRGAARINIAQ